MPDAVAWRAKFATIVPSTNTVVEYDYNDIRPAGITFHAGRMYIADGTLGSDDDFEALLEQIRASIGTAIRDVLTCEPDHIVMGMSAETFWGGVAGNERFERRVRELTGLEVTTGATSCREALRRFGAERIAVISPYQPVADENVTRFFEESGFRVHAFTGLRCPSATAIAQVSERELVDVLRAIDHPSVDAIVQVGTNLSMVRLADEAERWLGKPVLAINAATIWHALRSNGFADSFRRFGSLLREH